MGTIDLQTAKTMVKKYTDTRRTLINQTYAIKDTRAIWFSKEEVQAFAAGLTDDTTGVRIYLAAYDASEPTYPNQTTIIAIPTIKDASGNDSDPVGNNIAGPLDGGGGQSPMNHGTLCPPNTNCGPT